MNYCCILNRVFDKKEAQKDLKRYSKKGLNKETKLLIDFLKDKIANLDVLDIGCGIGDLTIELAKKGANNSLGIDMSEAYIKTAKYLSKQQGFEQTVDFEVMDSVNNEEKIKKMDVVVSNKVICCYPDMQKFINASASHTKKYYGIIFPNDNILVSFFSVFQNWFYQFSKRKGFRLYIHNNEKLRKLIESHGLKRIFNERKGFWMIGVFMR